MKIKLKDHNGKTYKSELYQINSEHWFFDDHGTVWHVNSEGMAYSYEKTGKRQRCCK
jgi:hypothetical protein